MDISTNTDMEREVSLKSAIVIIIVVAAFLSAIGLFVGYKFFWNQFEKETLADIKLKNAQELVKKIPKTLWHMLIWVLNIWPEEKTKRPLRS